MNAISQSKVNAMEAFKTVVAAIHRLPMEVVDAMNPAPTMWNSYSAVISQAKQGVMSDFGITTDEWDDHFDGWRGWQRRILPKGNGAMRLTLEIRMDNAAFDDQPLAEAARILSAVSVALDQGDVPHKLFDANGNCIGHLRLTGRVKPVLP